MNTILSGYTQIGFTQNNYSVINKIYLSNKLFLCNTGQSHD